MSAVDNELMIVVRAAGERTINACQAALRAVSSAPLAVTDERPFTAALRKSFILGIESGRTFALCVDADIIMAPRAIEQLVAYAHAHPRAFVVNGLFLDKYYGEPKARGVHLYRTSILEEALSLVPKADDVERPETTTKMALIDRGHEALVIDELVLGLHGWGQYYRDSFRTMASRGRKSSDEFAFLMRRFSRHAGYDADLRVALWGLVAGREGRYSLDANHWATRVDDLLQASGLREKEPLQSSEERRLLRGAWLAGRTTPTTWRRLHRFTRFNDAA